MSIAPEVSVARRLAELEINLLAQIADDLAVRMPVVDLNPYEQSIAVRHHQQMHATAKRFHELVLLGSNVDWSLVAFEYAWTVRVLRPLGITWEHQLELIDSYFTAAKVVTNWEEHELMLLDSLAERLRSEGERAYQTA